MGNHNHIVVGLTESKFVGLNTWIPKKPSEPNLSFFWTQPYLSSVVMLKAAVTMLPFCISRSVFPSIDTACQVEVVCLVSCGCAHRQRTPQRACQQKQRQEIHMCELSSL